MASLRQEIKEIIRQSSADNFHGPDKFNEETTDEIIKLFEKRIDEKIKNLQRRYKYAQKHYLTESLEKELFCKIDTLKQLKEELKKK